MTESDMNEYAISLCSKNLNAKQIPLPYFMPGLFSFRTQTPKISWQSISWVQVLLPNLCPLCSLDINALSEVHLVEIFPR